MLVSNISMASTVSNLLVSNLAKSAIPCQMMMADANSSAMHSNHANHQASSKKDMEAMGIEASMTMEDCCSTSDCPMTSCASPTLQSTPNISSETIQMTHLVQVLYQDLPLFLIISPHYRPPIQTLS